MVCPHDGAQRRDRYRAALQGHTDSVIDLAFTPDSSSLLSSGDSTLRVLLPLDEIERQLGAHLDVLATTFRDMPARHRSMRAVFDHSWRLLSERERALFSHVAVFRGGWTADAVAQVTGAMLPALTALIDKSLVQQEGSAAPPSSADRAVPNAGDEPRYAMLEPIREYALAQLAARGEAEALGRAHASYYLGPADAAATHWDSPNASHDSPILHCSARSSMISRARPW